MKTCLKMILMSFVSVSFFSLTFLSESAHAQAFIGCDNWCGKRSNNVWWAYLHSKGLNENSSPAQKAPHTPTADRLKDEDYRKCLGETLAEGKTSEAECNGEPTGSVPTPSGNPNRCETEYTNLVKACDNSLSSAKSSCDQNSSSAFSSNGGGDETSSGVSDACKAAGGLSNTGKSAWTTFKNSCSSGMDSCLSTCSELTKWADSNASCFPLNVNGQKMDKAQAAQKVYSPRADQCLNLQAEVDKADKNISTYADNATTSAECESATNGGAGGTEGKLGGIASALTQAAGMFAKKETATNAEVATFCQTNPAYPGCSNSASMNCSDPNVAASNKVCLCAASPRDPQCMSYQSASTSDFGSTNIDSSSRLPSQADAFNGGDIPQTPVDPLAPFKGGGGSPEGIDGRQGGSGVGSSTVGAGGGPNGGGGGAGGGEEPGGGGPNGGFYGGGSGGGAKVGAVAGGGGGYRNPGSGSGPGAPGSPDLRQFLPGGMQDPRSRGMIGGVGTDGITGPHTNIWQKVQNRYRVIKDTLIP